MASRDRGTARGTGSLIPSGPSCLTTVGGNEPLAGPCRHPAVAGALGPVPSRLLRRVEAFCHGPRRYQDRPLVATRGADRDCAAWSQTSEMVASAPLQRRSRSCLIAPDPATPDGSSGLAPALAAMALALLHQAGLCRMALAQAGTQQGMKPAEPSHTSGPIWEGTRK